MIKKAYHYTTLKNWKKIKTQGLKIYDIDRIEFSSTVKVHEGIYMWPRKQNGKNLLGSLIYQLAMKNTEKLVELEVKYDTADILFIEKGHSLNITHSGGIENYAYHNDLKSVITTKYIPPKNIKLSRSWDLLKLIK